MSSLYNGEPKINKDGNRVFCNNGIVLFSGLVLFMLFSAAYIMMDFYVQDTIIKEKMNVDVELKLYAIGYASTYLVILLSTYLLVIYFTHKVTVTKNCIIKQKMFSTKTIMLFDVKKVTYLPCIGILFVGSDTKILFGAATNGINPYLGFVGANIPKERYEKSFVKFKKDAYKMTLYY